MTAPLTLEDVLAWLEAVAARDQAKPSFARAKEVFAIDEAHSLFFGSDPNAVLLVEDSSSGTALETGTLRQALETAKELGLLPAPKVPQRRGDAEPTPPADVLRDWCKRLLANEAPNALLAPEKSSVGVLRDDEGFPVWAVFVSQTLDYGRTSLDVLVANVQNAPNYGPHAALVGTIMWDGCLHLDTFQSSDECWFSPAHFCGPDGVHGLEVRAKLMRCVWALAWGMFEQPDYDKPHVDGLEIVLTPPKRVDAT